MGCCTSHISPITQSEHTDPDDIPPLHPQKTYSKEALKLRTSNYVLRTKEDIAVRYQIEKQIGEGGFGTVYRAIHRASGQTRAIKTISKGFMDEEVAETMLKEVGIMRSLVSDTQDHPNIIKVFEVVEDEGNFHIVSEMCTGGDLFDRVVKVSHFSETVVAKYMQQILSAIAYCHDLRIVHRDLKPENLLLETDRQDALLKVIDFGTSSKLRPNRYLRGVIGTVYYMAPEVITGHYNEKCDIWSCGVIMYILLCTNHIGGHPPFPGKTDEEIEENIQKGEVSMNGQVWEEVSMDAKEFVMKMLTKEPTDRPSAKELLKDSWLSQPDTPIEDRKLKSQVLSSLSSFRSGCRFREAALQFIAWQLTPADATSALERIFLSLDADMDGKLSLEDLEKGFRQVSPGKVVDIPAIMRSMDSDGNGFVDYHEFLMASLNWKQVLTTEVMENAFRAFDKDGNGKIEVGDMKLMLQGEQDVDSGVWLDVLGDVDSDGNGVVFSI